MQTTAAHSRSRLRNISIASASEWLPFRASRRSQTDSIQRQSGLARPRPHIGAFAGSRARPDFHRLARWRIEEALAGEAPVRSRRGVERAPLVAALAEDKPDQKERETEAEGQAKRDHDTGSITAAVP